MTAQSLGDRLRSTRKRRGLTQRELAELSGVSVSLIRQLEQGQREDTRVETLRRLVTALRVSTTDLIVRHEAVDETPAEDDLWAPVRAALLGLGPDAPGEEPTAPG